MPVPRKLNVFPHPGGVAGRDAPLRGLPPADLADKRTPPDLAREFGTDATEDRHRWREEPS